MIGYTQCLVCIHLRRALTDGTSVCDAYPEGIPRELLFDEVVHDRPYAGDDGVVFEVNPLMWSVDRNGPFYDHPFYRKRIAEREAAEREGGGSRA